MKKKNQKKEPNVKFILGCILLMLILIIVSLVFYYDVNKYNPDKHVCEEYNKKTITEWITLPSGFVKIYPKIVNGECMKYRLKTKCEINPEHPDCVCDEYNSDTQQELFVAPVYGNNISVQVAGNCDFCDPNINKKASVIMCEGDECSMDMPSLCCDLKRCIKAHEKNECEKGNPDWIDKSLFKLDKAEYKEGELFIGTVYLGCRRKIIEDYSCTDLKKALLTSIPIITQIEPDWRWWWEYNIKKHSFTEVYDVAVKKGCDL